MCLFWWNTDIYLCGTSKTIASFSTANWINAPSGCWARSRAENCIFCYAAALYGSIHFALSAVPSPSLSILKPLLENPQIQQKNGAWVVFFSLCKPSTCEPECLNTHGPLFKYKLLGRLPCHAKYRSHLEFLPVLRDICLWDFLSGHLSLWSIKQCSILLSDPTQSKPFGKKS